MKTKILLSFTSLFVSSGAGAMTVDWKLTGPNPIKGDNSVHECSYSNVLQQRAAKKETDPPVLTLSFKKPGSLPRMDHEACQLILSNLTNLDQVSVRDQMAKIISSFPCPNANIKISSFQSLQDVIPIMYPNARSMRSLHKVRIDGCLKERPDSCVLPQEYNPDFVMTYLDLKEGLEYCAKAMNDAVQKGAELAAWQEQNDPNKASSQTAEKHKE